MKKQLIEAIKAKFVGIDDNTANRLAQRAIAKSENGISTEDEVQVAVEAITLADVLKSVNDFSADEAVKKYEEKYGLEKGEKKEKPTEEPKKPEDQKKPEEKKSEGVKPEDAMKALLAEFKDSITAEFKSVKDDLAAMKSGKISESRKAKLDAIIKDLKDFQKKPYGRIDLSKMSDEEFEDLLTEVKEEVGDILADNKAQGLTPPLGGRRQEVKTDTKEATKEEIDALVGKFGL